MKTAWITVCCLLALTAFADQSEEAHKKMLREDAKYLEIGYAPGDNCSQVTSGLTLPARGANGSHITWTSSQPQVIQTNGQVNRPLCAHARVELQARLELGGRKQIKTFTLSVLRRDPPPSPSPFSHTISLDGQITPADWPAAQTLLPAPLASYPVYISWNRDWLYLALQSSDIAVQTTAAGQKWLNIYLGIPCRTEGGTFTGQKFRNQSYRLPFEAHFAIKWRPSDFFFNSALSEKGVWRYTTSTSLSIYNPLAMNKSTAARTGDQLEIKISRQLLGDPDRVRLLLFFLREDQGQENTWGIIPEGSAPSGQAQEKQPRVFSNYIELDFTGTRPPALSPVHKAGTSPGR